MQQEFARADVDQGGHLDEDATREHVCIMA